MYIYFIVFCIVLTVGLVSFIRPVNDEIILILLLVITCMLAFRYGQGTDYFNYNYIFVKNSSVQAVFSETNDTHGEIGFKLLCSVFRGNYQLFVAVTSIYEMFMFKRFLWKHSDNKGLALLLFFPTLLLTYFFSAVRQGIVLATFLGEGISLAESKKWGRFVVMSCILSTFHGVALILLVIPLLEYISLQLELIALAASFGIGGLLSLPAIRDLIGRIPIIGPRMHYYMSNIDISYYAIVEKAVTLCMVLLLYLSYRRNKGVGFKDPWWIKAYIFGHFFFFIMMPYSLIAGRAIIFFKALEVLFVPNILNEDNRYRQIAFFYFCVFSVVLYFHHVGGYISEGSYNSRINKINYPYISIFEKNEISDYRSINNNLLLSIERQVYINENE